MLRQVWPVLALLLLLSLSINAQKNSTKTLSPTIDDETTTSKPIETTPSTVEKTTTPKPIETTPLIVEKTTTTKHVETTPPIVDETTTTKSIETTSAIVGETTTTKHVETTPPIVDETTTSKLIETTSAIVGETTTTKHVETTPPIVDETTTSKLIETTSPIVHETTTPELVETTSTLSPETTITTTPSLVVETTIKNEDQTLLTTASPESQTNETTTNRTELSNVTNQYPHPGKPEWSHIEPSKPVFAQDELLSLENDLVQKIILELAEYIKSQTNTDLTQLLPSVKDYITNELTNKLDQSQLNLNTDDLEAIRGTTKVFLKNLPFIINTIISNIKKVGDENCSIRFTFFNNIYCLKFELNLAPSSSSPPPTVTPSLNETKSNVSIESFKVFNLNHADTAPPSWQQWLDPTKFQDQPSPSTNEPAIVCYYTNWAQYRNGPGRFYPENIDPNLCTHINYAFAQLRNGVIAPYEWNDESTAWSTGMFARMMSLRKANRPKILLALGGWNHGSGKFSDMALNETKRATFIETTIIFLQKHKFDGLDLDWEYPGSRDGSRPTDKEDFVQLLVELKAAFRPYSLLLTAAVGAGKPTIDAAYDIPAVCDNLDLVNLMSYDLHGSWESTTGIHVALYGRQQDSELNKQLTQDWAVRYWIGKGCSPSKLVMGLALYGRTFRLASSSNNKIGAPTVGPGSAGLYTGEAGFLGYYEICTRIQQQNWTKVFDEEQKANYAYKGQEWVGFDDIYSIGFKIRYAKDMGLAGIMFWAPDLDDFTGGLCNEGKYPLMNTAVNLLRGQVEWITSTAKPTTTTTTTTVSPLPSQHKRVVCYYTNWAQYRPDGGKFLPENLDASLCTHIIYAFAVLKDSKLAPYEWNDEDTEWSKGMYTRTMALKSSNNVKILLAVGGWNFGSGPFSDMVGNETLRKEFVQQATQFIRDNKFDGLDVDWEYPGSREGSRPEDKQLFTTLIKELKAAFQPYNLLLTAAVGAGDSTIETAYEIDKIAPHLDFINLMTYDLHGGGWENFTGFHTALYARPEENQEQMTLNQNWAVNHWLQSGMPKEKISMGLATYGRTYKLVNTSDTGIGAPSSGPSDPGNYTREKGFLSYYEICEKLNSGLWTSKYDDVQKSMYAYGEGIWVGYDNIDTLTIRANYILGKDLGGVMIWAPDLDDFSGKFCNHGPYPLMNTVVNIIRAGTSVPIVIPTLPTSTTTTSTTAVIPPLPTTASPPFTLPTLLPPITTPPTTLPSVNPTPPSVVCMTTVNPFVFQTLNVNLCSHLIIIQTESLTTGDSDIFQSALSSDTIEQLKLMKQTNPKLKVLYSILGQWKTEHLTLIRDAQQRSNFNQQIQQYLVNNNLDGLDIDWNLKPTGILALTDKYLLSTWLLELKNAFSLNQLSLSIGISADKLVLDSSYDFNKIPTAVDFVRLMAFDWSSKDVTALINPLYPVNNQRDDNQYNNINWVINYVITLGIPPEQISLGIPTYGRWYGLADGNQNTIGARTTGSSITLAYSDICKLLKSSDYIKAYNTESRSSYSYNIKKKQWISADAINDVALKATFVQLEGLGGVTLSSIGMDDVDGQCGDGTYPILNAVASVFHLQTKTKSSINVNTRSNVKSKNIICSISSKADSTGFTLDKIDARLCTHLLIDNTNSLISSSIFDQLKTQNSNLKILLTIDLNENVNINQWTQDIKRKKADGINININSNTISNNILEEIKSFSSPLSNEYLFTISFQLPTDSTHQALFFNILQLHKIVDYLILLPFDEKSIENFKEIQPWNSLSTFIQADAGKNIGDYSMISALMFILQVGVPKDKLIMSIPTYGLSLLLENQDKYQIGDKISELGVPGSITKTKGLLAAYEICNHLQSDNYERFLSKDSVIVMAHEKKNLILFDDTQPLQLQNNTLINGTVELKATFIKHSQLAGVLVHLIDMDDYTGNSCQRGVYPITSIISRVFSAPLPSTGSTTRTMKKNGICANVRTQDLLEDIDDCQKYYVCLPNKQDPIAHLQCPNKMYFSSKRKACTQDQSSCSSNTKFNPVIKPIVKSEEPSSPKPDTPFTCPKPDGIFPNLSDCTKFYQCSNGLIYSTKCPAGLKFNSLSSQCDWTSNLCP